MSTPRVVAIRNLPGFRGRNHSGPRTGSMENSFFLTKKT